MVSAVKQYFQGLLSIMYPHCCAACGSVLYTNEHILCLRCLADLPRTGFHNDPENEVARIFWGRIPVVNATSFIYFTKDSRYRQILHELKYKGQQQVGIELGRLFGLELKQTPFASVDLIHPVPLHSARQRQRGYNQSEMIARGISGILSIPLESGLIVRSTDTRTQTKKSRFARWENVKDTFAIPKHDQLCNKHILLVDDVITTGATIEACAQAVLTIQGVSISVASLACVKLQ